MYRRSFILALIVVAAALSAFPQRQTAVMWTPVDIAKRNLYYGAGGTAIRPNTRRIRYLGKQEGGNNLKYRIRDASGRVTQLSVSQERVFDLRFDRVP